MNTTLKNRYRGGVWFAMIGFVFVQCTLSFTDTSQVHVHVVFFVKIEIDVSSISQYKTSSPGGSTCDSPFFKCHALIFV